jgi:DNA-binding CsgD family transcriptional regulator
MDGDQPQQQSGPTHGPNGDFIATVETAERDAEAARLRSRGLSYRAIAAELGIDVHTAHDAVQRALQAIRAEGAVEARTIELQRLDGLWEAVLAVLERATTEPGTESDTRLKAVATLLKVQERRARLLGLDAETKVSVSGGVTYEIIGIPTEEL